MNPRDEFNPSNTMTLDPSLSPFQQFLISDGAAIVRKVISAVTPSLTAYGAYLLTKGTPAPVVSGGTTLVLALLTWALNYTLSTMSHNAHVENAQALGDKVGIAV